MAACGITIGDAPNLLHMLAVALFEFLACGRCSVPSGSEAGEPFGAFVRYLITDEVTLLAASLAGVFAPDNRDAEEDHLAYRYQHDSPSSSFRLVEKCYPDMHPGRLNRFKRRHQKDTD